MLAKTLSISLSASPPGPLGLFPSTFALKHAKLIYRTVVGVLIRFLPIKSYIMILSRAVDEAKKDPFLFTSWLSNEIILHLSIVSL